MEERSIPLSGIRGRVLFYARHPGVRQRVFAPVSFNMLVLGTNLATGIIIARTLGPSGRGQISAILVLVFTAAWIFSMGSTTAVSYRQSHRPNEGPLLIGSWLVIAGVVSALAIIVSELVLPALFGAQTSETITLARIYIPAVTFTLLIEVFYGILLGDQDFIAYNVARALLPGLVAVFYVVLLVTGALSVEAALVANAAAAMITCAAVVGRSIRRHGVRAPRVDVMRETVWYGIQAHGGSVAGFVNARLDLLIIPAFLSAASVGLYSVATNASSIIGTLVGSMSMFVLPVAVRRQQGGPRTVIRTMHAALLIGVAVAIPLGILAGFAVDLLYGSKFSGAVTALRVLLPGEVLDVAAMVLWAGLQAANKPFLSTVAALPAAILTIVGLVIFLQSGGIVAAAIVSTCAYAVVFVLSIALYRRVHALRWSDFIRVPSA